MRIEKNVNWFIINLYIYILKEGKFMAVFKCKMCGGSLDIEGAKGIITCDYCGTHQTLPKTEDEVTTNLFNRANNLRLKNEFDKAQELYEKIISTGSTDAEAFWGNVLCKFGIEYVEDPATFKRVPTCHRTQLEPVLSDVDYKSAIENADDAQKAIYEAEARAIDELQKDILRIIEGEEPFDVFICYKETDEEGKRTPDSVIANDIYHQLTQEGMKVFYAAITLEDKLGQEYEPYIFSALNSSKVMLVVGTKPEYFNAVWVRNEWSRFLKIVKNDRQKTLIPCYKDMDAYDLPEEFSHLQAQDMSKIGFINDIVRGIKKLVPTDSASQVVAKASSEQSVNNTDSAKNLIDKAFLLIEDGNKNKAKELLNQALDMQPKNSEAYLGLLMIEMDVKEVSALGKCASPLNQSQNYQRAIRFGSNELKKQLEEYDISIQQGLTEKKYNDAVNIIKKNSESNDASNVGGRIAAIRSAENTLKSLGDYKDSAELAEKCKGLIEPLLEIQKAQQKKKNKVTAICLGVAAVVVCIILFVVNVIVPSSNYKAAVKLSEDGKYAEAIAAFEALGDYKDSDAQIIKNNYMIAEDYYKDKDYTNASKQYEKCGDYEDTKDKLNECFYQMAVAYLNDKNWDAANPLFEQIKGYKDSADLIHYHNNEVVESKDATCTEDGSKTYECKDCGYSYTETISALGHNFSTATCTEDSKCSRCGATGDAALGHTATTICERCGKNTFETLKYEGKGNTIISGINLPEGNFKWSVTFTTSKSSEAFCARLISSDGSFIVASNNAVYSAGESWSDVELFQGPLTNAYIELDNEKDASWVITIEGI